MKKLLVLTLCFAGLAAFVYFYEIAGQEEREKAQELEESLFRIEQDDITRIEIRRGESDPVVLVKGDGGWRLEEPIRTAADQSTVNTFLGTVTGAKRARTLEEPGDSLADYGLENPQATLIVESGERQKTLAIGSEDFTGNQLYAKFEDGPELYLTASSLLTAMEKETLDWRNKDAMDFERSTVTELQIQRKGETLGLEKVDERWRLVEPIAEAADSGTVDSLLSTLDTAKAESFVEEEAGNLAPYGLDAPPIVVRLREEGSDSWERLEIGSEIEDGYYARNPEKGAVITLASDIYSDLTKELWDFREKDVVDVSQGDIEKLTLRKGDEELVVAYSDFKWLIEAPEEFSGQEALSYKFWYPIDDIEFQSILDQKREIAPEVVLTLALQDGSERNFHFARAGDEYLAVQVETGKQGVISPEDYEKLQVEAADIVESLPDEAEGEGEEPES